MKDDKMLDWENFKPLLGRWADKLKPWFLSDEGYRTYEYLKMRSRGGAKITPRSSDVYNFLKYVYPENLKVVIIAQDVYPGIYNNGKYHSSGIALDCSNSNEGKLQPSLKSFWEGIANEYGEPYKEYATHDLKFLCTQGVMLSNRSLTCELHKIGIHLKDDLWDSFWRYMIKEVIPAGVIYIFLGKEAAKLRKYVFELSNTVYVLDHPSAAARGNTLYDTKDTFKKVNVLLKETRGDFAPIEWCSKIFETIPF